MTAILPKRGPKSKCAAGLTPAGDNGARCKARAVTGSVYCAVHRAEAMQRLQATTPQPKASPGRG